MKFSDFLHNTKVRLLTVRLPDLYQKRIRPEARKYISIIPDSALYYHNSTGKWKIFFIIQIFPDSGNSHSKR